MGKVQDFGDHSKSLADQRAEHNASLLEVIKVSMKMLASQDLSAKHDIIDQKAQAVFDSYSERAPESGRSFHNQQHITQILPPEIQGVVAAVTAGELEGGAQIAEALGSATLAMRARQEAEFIQSRAEETAKRVQKLPDEIAEAEAQASRTKDPVDIQRLQRLQQEDPEREVRERAIEAVAHIPTDPGKGCLTWGNGCCCNGVS